jgi:glycosyltransferase involved in cell wall biosynthesis
MESLVRNPPKKYFAGGLRLKGIVKDTKINKPLITIITPTYNAISHLSDTIESIRSQTYDNVEWIVIDGASTDGTIDLIKQNEDVIDYWVSEQDNGIYEAINKAVKFARGDWCFFLGSDDILVDCFAEIKEVLLNKRCIYYGNVILSSTGKISGGPSNPLKLMWKNIPHQAILYPRTVFSKYSYNVSYPLLADYHLNLILFADREFSFKYIDRVFAVYNDVTGKSSISIDVRFKTDKARVIDAYYHIKYKIPYYLVRKIKNCLRRISL